MEPGCSAAVAVDGRVEWARAFGLADVAAQKPLTTDSRFDFASVSKQFTATAIMLLVGDGVMSLSDPVSRWQPSIPLWAERITVGDLLHHMSGIPDYTHILIEQGRHLDDMTTQADAMSAIKAANASPLRGNFEYSNSNYILLAEIVHEASGLSLAEFLEARVFNGSGLTLDPVRQDTVTGYAEGAPITSHWQQVGDGAVVGTPSELAEWADYYRIGLPEFPELPLFATAEAVDTGSADASAYGAGILVGADGTLSHIGSWAGVVTLFGVTADRHTSIVVSCNDSDAPANELAQSLRTIWQEGSTP